MSFVKTDCVDIILITSIPCHFERTSSSIHISHLHNAMYPNYLYFNEALTNGHVSLEAFLYLNRENYIFMIGVKFI